MFNKLTRAMKDNRGFTLVELMVVVVIIGVLVAIAVPVYSSTSASAREKASLANIRIIEGAIQAFMADNVTSGGYSDVIMSNAGEISGVTLKDATLTSLVPKFIKEMPKNPDNNSKTYTKAADGDVIKEP